MCASRSARSVHAGIVYQTVIAFLNQCIYAVTQSGEDNERRLKRREKNRVAAQRSRKRQTQRADELHEVRLEKPRLGVCPEGTC